MSTPNPFADPEHPIDFNIKGKDVEPKPQPANPVESKSRPIEQVYNDDLYMGLLFEKYPPVTQDTEEKVLFSYKASHDRVSNAINRRHPRPHEALGLIIDGLEGKLSGDLKKTFDDMVRPDGEWLSLAFERKDDALFAYIDPEGAITDRDCFDEGTFNYKQMYPFDIKGKQSNYWTLLKDFSNDFVIFLTGRKFDQLPECMQRDGRHEICVWLPPENRGVFPVSYDFIRPLGDNCNLLVDSSNDRRASRGVYEPK